MADTKLAIFIISLIISELNKYSNERAETARMDKEARSKFTQETCFKFNQTLWLDATTLEKVSWGPGLGNQRQCIIVEHLSL